ncbi:hypothetical protein CPB85DRAFT_645889 [Mucidula mucida]|nr:hypothetical protein CPB85DRAFT_645889 [Mucidula mucida]
MSQWKTEANKLIFDGKAPMALLRYRYADADMASADGLKQVLKPSFKAFTAACYEAGMLTLSRGLPKHYVFPDRMTRLQLDMDVLQPIENKGAMIPPPFDGSPKWIDTVFTPYLRKSRTAYSVLQSSENEMQSALHQKLDTSLVVGGGIANHVALEVNTIGRRRIDILAITLAMLCIIEMKNIPLVALYEATMGVTLARTANGKDLTEGSIALIESFFKHILRLPISIWTESDFNPDYQN